MNSYSLEGFSLRDRFSKRNLKPVPKRNLKPVPKRIVKNVSRFSMHKPILSGYYIEPDVLGFSVKKTIKKAQKSVMKNTVKALKSVQKEVDNIPADVMKATKNYVKENINFDKLTEVSNTLIDSTLNSLPIVSTVNQTLEAVGIDVSQVPAELQTKIIEKGTNLVKEQIQSAVLNKTADGNNKTGNTGAFMSFVVSHKDFENFGLTQNQLNVMNPDELYNVVRTYISAKKLPIQIRKCDASIDADIAKIYYYFTGQPKYNAFGELAYKSIKTISEDIDKYTLDTADKITVQASGAPEKNNVILICTGIAGLAGLVYVMSGRK